MTAIPQRLRDIVRSGPFDERRSAILKLADEIAAELESPHFADSAKPLDDPRLQELFGCAIDGALTSGYQGVAPAPEGHWLKLWWDRGRAVAEYEQELRSRIDELEARQWFLADETDDSQDDVWSDAADAYAKAAGALRGHLEWRDRIRAAVRVLIASGPQQDARKEQP